MTHIYNGLMDRAVGECPLVVVKIGGIPIKFLIDTGSQVSTINERLFNMHFKSNNVLHNVKYLNIRAANGIEIPYAGCMKADVELSRSDCVCC